MAKPMVIMTESQNQRENRVLMAYNINQISDNETEIEICDVITNKKSRCFCTGEEGDEVTPQDIQEQISSISTKNITIRMNSAGGEVSAANAIAVAIQEAKKNGKTVKCKIVGMCASAAVQIATVCDEVIIHASALMMIHNPMAFLCDYYDINALKKACNFLEATKNGIMNYYVDKTGISEDKISEMMDAETWMNGKEAVEKGFADTLMFEDEEEKEEEEVINRVAMTANMNNDFLRIPERFKYAAVNKTTKEGARMEIRTTKDLTAAYPEIVAMVREEAIASARESAVNEGIEQERSRIKAIDDMTGKVSNELLMKAKYETFDTAEKVALDAINQGSFVNTTVLNALDDESQTANGIEGATNNGVVEPAVDKKKQETEHAKSVAESYFKSIGKK